MTTNQLKARLAKLEAALHPEADPFGFFWLGWADDPIPPEFADAPIIRLHWPDDPPNGAVSASSPLGLQDPPESAAGAVGHSGRF